MRCMWFPIISAVVLTACSGQVDQFGGQSGSLRDVELPEGYERIDYGAAFTAALEAGGAATFDAAWQAHAASLADSAVDCPQVAIGAPAAVDATVADTARGMSWADECDAGPLHYDGYAWWQGTVAADQSGGTRALSARAVVAEDVTSRFSFDGEGFDSLDQDELGWRYTSVMDATVRGSELAATPHAPGGFHAQLISSYTSDGDLALNGIVSTFGSKIEDVFHTARYQLSWGDGCAAEPQGHMSLRDDLGFWYDLYFLPEVTPEATSTRPFPNETDAACDGCGHLFIRNLPVEASVGLVCPDFDGAHDRLVQPDLTEYVVTLRELLPERP